MINKIKAAFDNSIERSINKDEERKYLKLLKQYCKKNNFESDVYSNYALIIKKIMKDVNNKSTDKYKKNKFEICLSMEQIKNRLYQLNKEFIHVVNLEYFNAGNALARQLIELYLITYQINSDNDYANVFVGNYKKHKGFPPFGQIIKKINNNKVSDDYSYYSGIFHPKEDSFIRNLFLIPPTFNGRMILPFDAEITPEKLEKIKKYNYTISKPYYKNHHLMKKGWRLASVTKNSMETNSRDILDDFMHYSTLIIKEMGNLT